MTLRRRLPPGYLFILPAVALLGLFVVYPLVWTIRLSFDSGLGLKATKWVGLRHYKRLLTNDPSFLDLSEFPPKGAVVNNVLWMALFTTVCIGLGLLIAILADRVQYESVVKAVIFVPMAISATAVGVIWLLVYAPDANIGVVNAVISGLGADPVSWLGRTGTVNYAIIFAYVWAWTGFAMVVLSAALKGIPTEIVEASRVDGAREWDRFRRITLPLLAGPMAVVAVTLVITVIKVFDIIFIMTRGGPNGASEVMGFQMYVATFVGGRGGYGSAIAVLMFVMVLPIMLLNVRRFRAQEAGR